ncbi:MAG: TonB-dependent receptor, partial [Novosphingobium sp.]
GGDWQYSVTRPNDKTGAKRQVMGRLLLDWDASSTLKFHLNVNGFRDRSDVQAPRPIENFLNVSPTVNPANPYSIADPVRYSLYTNPTSPVYDPTFAGRQALVIGRLAGADGLAQQLQTQLYLGQPAAPTNDARAAEWSPALLRNLERDYYQISLRGDLDITDDIKLTSITAYQHIKSNSQQDLDGSIAVALDAYNAGKVTFFSQELRLTGRSAGLNWIVGANFDRVTQDETNYVDPFTYPAAYIAPGFTLGRTGVALTQKANTYAAFGNVEYEVVPNLTIQGGIRYTKTDREATICGRNFGGDIGETILVSSITGVALTSGQCFQINYATFRPVVTPDVKTLNEENTSFRVGVNYTLPNKGLLYANFSRGYKSGIFSAVLGLNANQGDPAVQEKVDAIEGGFKMPLLDRKLQVNGAAFHYSYSNKQIRGKIPDPLFGLIEKLVNIPKSTVWGIEGEIVAKPIDGLTVSASGTYVKSKVIGGTAVLFNYQGYSGGFDGSVLPYTPKFSGLLDAQYDWQVGDSLKAFVGATGKRQSVSNSTLGNATLLNTEYVLPGYTTLDLRAGVGSADGKWKFTVFGRNVTNKVITTLVFEHIDGRYSYTAKPVTYGASIALKF